MLESVSLCVTRLDVSTVDDRARVSSMRCLKTLFVIASVCCPSTKNNEIDHNDDVDHHQRDCEFVSRSE